MPELILVVDDDPVSLAICKAILSPKYKVVTVHSGLQALGYLKENPRPDLIVSDISMPGMDGIHLMEHLKSQDATQDIPVILESALTDLDAAEAGFRAGADEFVVKPVIPVQLQRKVAILLECDRLRKENERLKDALHDLGEQLALSRKTDLEE